MLDSFTKRNSLSLYVHIPFCLSKCSYCAFFSLGGQTGAVKDQFTKVLLEELKEVVAHQNAPFETVYIGGGNPGILGYTGLESIVRLATCHGLPKEFTIEMNPESLDSSLYPLFTLGITRLSMGIQSLDPKHLHTLGRNATAADNLAAIQKALILRQLYGTKLNFDLMACIPGQSIEDAVSDIDWLVKTTHPEHISHYCLTIEEGTSLSRKVDSGELRVMDEEAQASMLESCWDRLEKLGYDHYEVSNFAHKDPDPPYCLHNMRYWDLQDYLGLGPSSSGTALHTQGLDRWKGICDVDTYNRDGRFASYELEKLDRNQEMMEYIMVALRTRWGIDKQRFGERFSYSFDLLFGDTLKRMEDALSDLSINNDSFFSLTEKGWMVMDPIVLDMVVGAGL